MLWILSAFARKSQLSIAREAPSASWDLKPRLCMNLLRRLQPYCQKAGRMPVTLCADPLCAYSLLTQSMNFLCSRMQARLLSFFSLTFVQEWIVSVKYSAKHLRRFLCLCVFK